MLEEKDMEWLHDQDLVVAGALLLGDQHGVHAANIKCHSLEVGMGLCAADKLPARDYISIMGDPSETIETWDVSSLTTRILITEQAKEVPSGSFQAEYEIGLFENLPDESKLFSGILTDSPGVVYDALKAGAPVNDAWALSNKEHVLRPDLREHLGLT